jgi:DNA-directed RNA polymerase specialized sigma24 family protein
VSETRATAREWALTQKALDRLLLQLDPDPERAGAKYEAIREKLRKVFDWRGARFPEECADETINRVARKLEAGEVIRDVPTYCHGVARLVLLEERKKAEHREISLNEAQSVTIVPDFPDDDTMQWTCFTRCLSELPQESRQLVLQYYQDERRHKINNRQAMADLLKIPMNALRSRVQRIRDKLEQCTVGCLKRSQSRATR